MFKCPSFSNEDLPETVLIDTWIQKQSNIDTIETFSKQFISKAISWVQSKNKELPSNGLIKNVLQNLSGTANKEEFCVRMVYGFGYALSLELQSEFAAKIFEWADIYIPNGEEPKFSFYNKYRESVETFQSDEVEVNGSVEFQTNRLIKSAKMKTYSSILITFFEQDVPFIMIGPSGSGKT